MLRSSPLIMVAASFHPLRRLLLAALARRHGGVAIFLGVFVAVAWLTRVALLVKTAPELTWGPGLLAVFGWGLLFDLGAAAFAALPLIVLLTVLPARWGAHAWQRALTHAAGAGVLYLLLFLAVAEWTFWDEFGVRFNFIAVDYLVYTTEVIGNIRESFDLPLILVGVLAGTLLLGGGLLWLGWPQRWLAAPAEPGGRRLVAGGSWLVAVLALGLPLRQEHLPAFANNYHRELARNGLWSLFAAFRNNVLDYDRFYPTLPVAEAFAGLREELVKDGSRLLRPEAADTLRYVQNPGPELRPNVIQLTVESLSAEFLGHFNPASTLTPNLDALAARSLVFERFYATGTRTDRGMEALTLSLPPTPGRSLIKRPRNEGLFTLGSVFRSKGYDTAFLYGGFGYFDNMNHFFGENGYRVLDRADVAPEDITFANVWGACDEDLFRWTLRAADAAHATGRPFHHFVMTTSNHRPFTFPEGRIDLPSKTSGRAGGVKYTDYAIGAFLRAAATKPWFNHTVFVIVADHCAESAGRVELPVRNYHIPLFIYAPGGQIAPGRITALTSQMDFAPTLLGLLHWSYPSRFFGHDVRRVAPAEAHALIGNYQHLGFLENGRLLILQPRRQISAAALDADYTRQEPAPHRPGSERRAIGYYAGASYLYQHGLYAALTPEEIARFTAQGEQLSGGAGSDHASPPP